MSSDGAGKNEDDSEVDQKVDSTGQGLRLRAEAEVFPARRQLEERRTSPIGGTGPTNYRPIIVEQPTRWQWALPLARARTAVVVASGVAGPMLLGSPGSPSRWSLPFRSLTVYSVDLGLHHTSIEVHLPSAISTLDFRATVWIEWSVADAVHVVRDNVHDVRDALRPHLRRELGVVTSQFNIEQIVAAERALCQLVDGSLTSRLGDWYGLCLRVVTCLESDAGTARHISESRAIEQGIFQERLEQERRMLIAENAQSVLNAEMAFYRKIVDSGDIDQMALQLARQPSDVMAIVQMIRDERHRDRRQVAEFVEALLQSNTIDRWDVDEQVQAALRWLKASTDRAVQSGETHVPWEFRARSGDADHEIAQGELPVHSNGHKPTVDQ